MKPKTSIFLLLFSIALTAPGLAADKVQETFQKGLFEEEANHNLTAAIQAYQSVLSQLDQQRKIAATTVFRLGECYRKLGKTNEATAHYQRVLREYGDQEILARLSQQNLAALGGTAPVAAKTGGSPAALNEEAAEVERLKAMIKDSPDLINAPGRPGLPGASYTPLQDAASRGRLIVASFLLSNGANPNESGTGEPPLVIAARNGHKSMVELLLAHKADVNAASGTALHATVEKGFRAVAEVLIAAPADVNAGVDSSDPFWPGTPLKKAIKRGDTGMLELLVTHGANVSAANRVGVTPLHFVAHSGAAETAAFLIKNGAKVDVPINSSEVSVPTEGNHTISAQGFTALHLAAMRNSAVAKVLVLHKADVNAAASNERTPLNLAAEYGTAELVRLLLEQGADVNKVEPTSASSPLHYAVRRRSREMVEAILAHKPRLEVRDINRLTASQKVVKDQGDVKILEMLLQAGADPNAPYDDDYTPIHLAVGTRNKSIVEVLLKYKANALATDRNGRTPSDYTIIVDQPGRAPRQQDAVLAEIAEMLRKAASKEEGSHRSSMLLIGRKDAYYPVFSKGTDDINRYTLFEVLATYYRDQISHESSQGIREIRQVPSSLPFPDFQIVQQPRQVSSSLPFPDFSRIIIHRLPDAEGKEMRAVESVKGDSTFFVAKGKEVHVNAENALRSGDGSHDLWLEWGDKVEIPELDHKLNEPWTGLSPEITEALRKCVQRKVTILVKEQATEVTLDPFAPIPGSPNQPTASQRSIPSRTVRPATTPGIPPSLSAEEQKLITEAQRVPQTNFQYRLAQIVNRASPTAPGDRGLVIGSFRLSQVLQSANVLRTSSDLTRVKVKRVDPGTKETKEMFLNLGQADPKTDLWLRDGDVIEVPEKE